MARLAADRAALMPRNSAVYLLVSLFLAASVSGCIRNPSIDIKRNRDRSYRIEVTRCSADERGERAIREDLTQAAKKQCGQQYRWREEPVFMHVWLGSSMLGECPAINGVATAICGESK
jgi:hypothetical protein